MNEKGKKKKEIMDELTGLHERDIDFSSGRIFGSMCTRPRPIAVEVDSIFHESNLGNPGLYPGTMEIERRYIRSMGELLHLSDPGGHVLSGGTEANITAIFRAARSTGKKKVLFPRSAHFSVLKAIKLMDLEPVVVELDDRFRMDTGDLEDKMDDGTACVFSVAGTTEMGAVDPIEKVSRISAGVPLHVDAAFGGFVLPFLEEMDMVPDNLPIWDFRVDGVSTLSTDPHKMGGSTIPAGCLLFREDHPVKGLSVDSPYLTSSEAYTLAGTRDSGALAGAYAAMLELGREGYREVVGRCMENTRYLKKTLDKLGYEPVMEPLMNILAVHSEEPGRIQSKMQERGYYISRIEDPSALRFVIMPHVTRSAIDGMVSELEGCT